MSTDIEEQIEPTAASLVAGIVGDLQRLVEQQFLLTRRELEEELRQRISAAAVTAAGIVILILAGIVFCLTLVHLLHWMASPSGTDPASIPLWVCHAVVMAALAVIGGILANVGQARMRANDA